MQEPSLQSFDEVMTRIVNYLPNLLSGFVVLILGAVIAWLVSRLVVRLLVILRLDRVFIRIGWGRGLEKGDVRHSLFGMIGTVCGLLIFLVFLENAILIWQLTVLSDLLEKLVVLIPQLMMVAAILLIGWAVADRVSNGVLRALSQEGFRRPRLIARIARSAILVFTCAIALMELDIAVVLVTGAFLIIFGALALCMALAFGLGSRQAVETMWKNYLSSSKDER